MSARTPNPSGLSHFVAEMKRRHVVRFAIGYAAAAFVVLQLAEIVFPAFDIGETGLRILVVAVGLLFPPALVLAWIYDVTATGIERTEHLPGSGRAGLLPHFAILGVTFLTMAVLGAWLLREGVLDEPAPARPEPAADEPTLVAYEPGSPVRSLAVLPMQDFSGGTGDEYFTAGMQEELIAQLSQIAGLRVVSRTSVQRYAGTNASIPRIGRELHVDAVIEGSVRRSADQVRITVQLIHAASDTHLWTQQYDRPLENVLALQSEVALEIARQIQAEVSPEETTALQHVAARAVDPQAQDAYLRGRYEAQKGTPEGLRAAKDLFESAVEEDSSFAPALAQLAGTRFLLGLADTTLSSEEAAAAQQEAERAVALDTTSQEAWEVLSLIRQHWSEPGGVKVVAGSLPERTGPGAARMPAPPTPPGVPDTAWVQAMTQMGRRIEEEVRLRGASIQRDADMGRFVGARGLMVAGRHAEAVEMLSSLVHDAPDMAPAWELLARAQVAAGNPQGAVDALREWGARGGDGAPSATEAAALQGAVTGEGARGYWRWQKERLDARAAAGQPVAPLELAAARAGVGDTEGAFTALEAALGQHDRGLALIHRDPVWDTLRTDPRFGDIARRSRATHPRGSPRPQGDRPPR